MFEGRLRAAFFTCAPGTGAFLEVKVLSQADHGERSEAQLRKGDRPWGGSVERICGPMDKNRIEGGADQGERSRVREAFVVKGQAASIRQSCSEGMRSYPGRSRLWMKV